MNLIESLTTNPILIVVVAIVTLVLFLILSRLFAVGDAEWKVKARAKADAGLVKARQLQKDGYSEQALSQIFTSLESAMKSVLKNPNISAFEAIQTLAKRGVFSDAAVAKLHFIRKLRNSVSHNQQTISPQVANTAISDATRIIEVLFK